MQREKYKQYRSKNQRYRKHYAGLEANLVRVPVKTVFVLGKENVPAEGCKIKSRKNPFRPAHISAVKPFVFFF